MAITLTGTGGVFTRWGVFGSIVNDMLALAGSRELPTTDVLGSLVTRVNNVVAQFASAEQGDIADLYPDLLAWQQTPETFIGQIADLCQTFFIDQANRQLSPGLEKRSFEEAARRLVTQMKGSGDSINKPTITTTVTAGGSNHGNATVVASLVAPSGIRYDFVYDEGITLTVTDDSLGSTDAGSETITALGEVASTRGSQGWDWPAGSGCDQDLTVIDGTVDAGNNLLTNSSFESFTGSVPTNWAVTLGAANISDGGSGNAYIGSHCLRIVGDGGGTLSGIWQLFDDATGTASALDRATAYAVNLYLKVSAVPAAGKLEIALVDSTGTVVNDDAGTANKFVIKLTSLTTAYKSTGLMSSEIDTGTPFFRTPTILPSALYLRIRLSVAIDNGKSVYADLGALGAGTQLYTNGPFAAAFKGSTDVALNDTWQLAVADSYDGKFVILLNRLFGLSGFTPLLQIPSSTVPTVSDALIV